MDELRQQTIGGSEDLARTQPMPQRSFDLILDLLFVGLAPITLMMVRVLQFWPYSVDDAFILLRYGRNLAQGHGLTYNVGMQSVEGYSNLLYVVFAAIAEAIGLNSLLVLKTIGVASALLTPAAVWWLVFQTGRDRLVARIAALGIALAPSYSFWAVSGLETPFTALLLTLSLVLGLRCRPGPDVVVAALMFLLAMTRPEGPVFAGVLFTTLLMVDWYKDRRRTFPTLRLARLVGPFALAYAVYFLARWWYFGVLLPNPIYFKTLIEESSWRDSMAVDYVASWWPVLILALLCLKFPGKARNRAAVGLVISGLLIYGRAQHYVVGGVGTMAFFGRYFLHVFPLLTVAACAALGHVWRRSQSPVQKLGVAALSLALGVWLYAGPDGSAAEMRNATAPRRSEVPTRIAAVADYVNSRYGPEAIVAVGDIGRNGYSLQGNVYDIFGLTSYEFTQRFDRDLDRYVDWIIDQRPTCFLVLAELAPGGFKPTYYPEARILANQIVREHYRVGKRLGLQPGSTYFYMVLEQRVQLSERGETGDTWWSVSESFSR